MNLLERMAAYSHEASWAVWEIDETGALTGNATFPLDVAPAHIHGRAMIVSLNPATSIAPVEVGAVEDWSNFHSTNRKHNDLFLAGALLDSPLWGAYMTDLHPEIVDSKSGNVRPKRDQVESAVRSLVEQAKLLGGVELIVGVGAKSFTSIVRHRDHIRRELGEVEIVRIPHYSRAAAGVHKHDLALYRTLIRAQVG